ncbi:hypothetical protein ACQPXB_17930 [Amycolatopsis sp. CA-161197]|uniref:hypothetical protein n=1 Tax=unclassified Amycolatopsis TaxID=2618356 RepID=UPI00345448D9
MDEQTEETYNPWTVVDLVFRHLVDIGLHPTLGSGGPPGEPAAELLRALGITPTAEGDVRIQHEKESQLAQLRAAMMEDG